MVMLFILNRSLTINCLKSQELVKLQERSSLHRNQVTNAIINCWVLVAQCTQLVFKRSLTTKDYQNLENYQLPIIIKKIIKCSSCIAIWIGNLKKRFS
jgi:hypothetical protein